MAGLIVSACLAGLPTRYDAAVRTNRQLLKLLSGLCWVPVCPEQLGGLATPRPACSLVGGHGGDVLDGRAKVVDSRGGDATSAYLAGAEAVLNLAGRMEPQAALLRSRSPSCGPLTRIGSDGSPRPRGVAAAMLQRAGIRLFEVEDTGVESDLWLFLSQLI